VAAGQNDAMHVPEAAESDPPVSRVTRIRKIVVRAVISIGMLVFSGLLVSRIFEEFSLSDVLEAIGALTGVERLSLASAWVIFMSCQGLMTSALLPGLPVRRGVIAYLGPAAVSSAVPGPSDLPVRYSMFTSWGLEPRAAQLAVGSNGIFSIGTKLVLPVLAGAVLLITPVPIEGVTQTIVKVSIVIGVGLAVAVIVFGSQRRTAAAGRLATPVWNLGLRILRKEPGETELADRLVAVRTDALTVVRDRWQIATWAAFLVSSTKFVLLLMSLRFVGVSEDTVPWFALFVVYAVVEGLSAVPITAGNVGVAEIAYITMLTSVAGGSEVNLITSGVLVFRILTWLVLIPAGLVCIGIWRHGVRRSARTAVAPGVEQ
jgi:hypothetical protein